MQLEKRDEKKLKCQACGTGDTRPEVKVEVVGGLPDDESRTNRGQ